MKCPQCGYSDEHEVKLVHNIMSTYVDSKTGKVDGIYNNNAPTITVKGKSLIRQDLYKPTTPSPTTAPVVKPAPVAPPTA